MRTLILLFLFNISLLAADLIEITPDVTFNYFFSIFFYLMIGLIAFYGVITFML